MWTEAEHPRIWARGQHNLGVTYLELPDGDIAENLHRATGYFEAALRVRTQQAFPSGWALTQYNLGETCLTLADLPGENPAARRHQAIAHFELALEVYTQADFPEFWAEAQNSLGCAWQRMPAEPHSEESHPEETLRRARTFYEAALEVWNEEDYPGDWAKAQQNLAETWQILAQQTPDPAAPAAARAAYSAARQGYLAVGLQEKAESCTLPLQAL